MDKSIAQTLNGLVPTLSDLLPPELLELAISLLAQSRNKASNLKAEEEISRSYACAHIACERLKQSLALPKIQPRPPCPPRVYQKLYRHLDSALQANTRRSARVPALKRATSIATHLPEKRKSPVKPSPARPTPTKNRVSHQPQPHSTVPEWVMPSIRLLCTALYAPAAPPHVFAGVSSILTLPAPIPLPKPLPSAFHASNKIPSLIVAVALIVYTRLSGVATPASKYASQKTLGLAVLEKCVPEEVERDLPADIDTWFREIRDRGWTLCDWFVNVIEGAGVGVGESVDADPGSDTQAGDGEDDEVRSGLAIRRDLNSGASIDTGKNTLLAGLGTMMQPKLDFLSDVRRKEYATWKKSFLARIEEAERREGVLA